MRTTSAHTFALSFPTMVTSQKGGKTMNGNPSKKYYLVTAMCGHVGKRKYVPINFAVRAENASEAAQLVKTFPRVKRHRKDAILECVEITREQYLIQKNINRRDPYLNAKCHAGVEMEEDFMKRVQSIKRKKKKERRPLSMKYRAWKAEGKYLAKAHCGDK